MNTMLTTEQRELVAAAVDGELSAAEWCAARELLDASADARALLESLKTDRTRLQTFPVAQASPPTDLLAKVMARVVAIPPVSRSYPAPAVSIPQRVHRIITAWAPVAVAAAVLLAVTLGSFAFFTKPGELDSAGAKPWSNLLPSPHQATPVIPSPNSGPSWPHPLPNPDPTAHTDTLPSLPHPREVEPKTVAVAPEPRPARHDLVASPLLPPIPPFDLIQARIPFLRAVAELDREDARQELSEELARDPARIDLFVRDTARGVDVFQNAAKAAGLHLLADATTLAKLKKHQVRAAVVYVECLDQNELAALFGKLSAADTKFTPRVCDSLHATALVRADEHELREILGTDVGLYKRSQTPGQGAKPPTDPKSVNAGTIEMVTNTLNRPTAKTAEKNAILMTWQTIHAGIPRTNPTASKELKLFLSKRGTRKPDSVPAIIVIRTVG